MSLIPYNSALTVRQDFVITPGVGTIFNTAADQSYATDSGEAIGGRYTISVVAGTITGSEVRLKAVAEHTTFPYDGEHEETITFGTPTETFLPGAHLLVPGTGIANSWTATIDLGDYLGAFNAGASGYVEGPTKLAAKNVGSVDFANCYARVDIPRIVYARTAGGAAGGLLYIRPYDTGADEKFNGSTLETLPYALTFANLDTAASPDEIDLIIDGSQIATVRKVDGGTTSDSLQLARDGATRYRTESGGLSGCELIINAAAINTDTGNIFVFPRRYIEIAPDVGGAAGTWTTTSVQLTETGMPAGTITAGNAAYYWRRISIPSGSPGYGPHPVDVFFEWSETAGIGWFA